MRVCLKEVYDRNYHIACTDDKPLLGWLDNSVPIEVTCVLERTVVFRKIGKWEKHLANQARVTVREESLHRTYLPRVARAQESRDRVREMQKEEARVRRAIKALKLDE